MSKTIKEPKLDFKDVSIVPQITTLSSRKQVELQTSLYCNISEQYLKGIPVVSANMSAVSTFEMAKSMASHGLFTALHKHYSLEELCNFWLEDSDQETQNHTFYTLGMHDLDKFKQFMDVVTTPKLICLDVANGYMEEFHSFIVKVRKLCPRSIIMAGNVVTPDGVRAIHGAGADIVKIGIGSSAVCRTRVVAGVGVPQFSAILDCYDAAKRVGALICSDGGCNVAGDFSKAFCAGADLVMSGTMFAGHDECGGEIVDGKMAFYGMSSEAAMNKHHGGMAKHRSSEGIHTMVPYKGPVVNTIDHILGGLRSCGTYIDAAFLSEFYDKSEFVEVKRTYNNIFGE